MSGKAQRHLTFANGVSLLALFIALSSGAYALGLPRHSVGAGQLRRNAVTGSKIRRGAVSSAKVHDGSLLASDFKAGQLPPGPRGRDGAPGRDGVNAVANVTYRRVEVGPIAQNNSSKGVARCQPGERLIGGGAGFAAVGSGFYHEFGEMATSAPGVASPINPQAARPVAEGETPDAWFGGGISTNAAASNLEVYAICASP
jgi:hypothetical protein